MDKPKKAFGYIRVSGQSQVEGDGFDRQTEAIERYAKGNNLKIVRWFREEGVSGTLESRPEFDAMMTELLADGVHAVVVERLDRLARELLIQEKLLAEFRKHGIELLSTAGGEADLGSSDPSRVLVRQMLGAVAQYDKSMIVSKLRAARMRVKAKTGKCEGRKFYGFRAGEQDILQRMKSMRDAGKNYEEIARTLNKEEIKTRTGGEWFPATIRRIVTR